MHPKSCIPAKSRIPARKADMAIVLGLTIAATLPGVAFGWGHDIKDPKTGEAQFLSTTKPNDFVGRWSLTSLTYAVRDGTEPLRLDVVPCGSQLCGIKLSAKGECLQKILTFKKNGSDKAIVEGDEMSGLFTGTFDWVGEVGKYYVAVDIYGADSQQDTSDIKTRRLILSGYPAIGAVPTNYGSRQFPISAEFQYVGASSCVAPSS